MSGLASNIGLFSGLPIGDIINQLMAIEARPLNRLQERLGDLRDQRTAYADLNGRLLALQAAASRFDDASFFRSVLVTSSRPEVLRGSAGEGARPGTYPFRVHALATAHHLISDGWPDSDVTPVSGGTLSIEVGQGHVAPPAFLEDLAGGVGRGVIEIQDQSGQTARIDLQAAQTLEDVLAAINTDSRIDIHARTAGDRVILTDRSGGQGMLVLRDISGTMVRDLGLTASIDAASGHSLSGADLRDLRNGSRLATLNDGNGVLRNTIGPDLIFSSSGVPLFEVELNERMDAHTHLAMLNGGAGVELGILQVETASGASFEANLTEERIFQGESAARAVQTVGDVVEVLGAAATSGEFTVQLDINTNQLVLTDHTAGPGTLAVADVQGTSARDLGLTTSSVAGVLRGAQVYRVATIGDVLRAINFAPGNYDLHSKTRVVQAGLQGNAMILSATGEFTVEAGSDGQRLSGAADDLGLAGQSQGGTLLSRRLLAGLGSVLLRSLNGGDGVTLGLLQVTAGGGGHFSVDLSAPDDAGHPSESLGDIIERFNLAAEASGTAVRAQINRAGNGLALVDDSMGSAALAVDDTPAALSLGLGDSAVRTPERIEGANLQLQYIAPARRLAELNNGSGVGTGTFVIHGASGSSVRIDVTSNQNTLGDLLDVINIRAAGTGIMAEFNDTGDGLVIRDASGGSQELRIVDEAGQVARSLRLLADARFRPTLVEDPQQPGQMIEVDEPFIEGRFESLVTVDSNDTVADVARKINAASAGVSAAIINDGSSEAPFHLSVVSATTGSAGHVVFDAGFTGLALHTLVGSRDAAVSFGGSDGADGLFIRSSTNTLAGVVEGVTVDLTGTSEDLVELTVESDVERLLQSMQSFVSAYNEVVERVGELSFFDGQTFEAGILRGDPVLRRIEARLQAVMNGLVDTGHPAIRRFADVGISFAPGGPREVDGVTVSAPRDGTIRFDENRFREVFASDPQAVLALFTNSSQEPVPGSNAAGVDAAGPGLGVLIQEVLDVLTRSGDGDLARRDAALQRQEQLFGQRARNIQTLLDARRARLQRQFVGLEEAIAALSSQQASLNTLQQYLLATRASEST